MFLKSFLCTLNDESYQNYQLFWRERTSVKRNFLQSMTSVFYHRFFVNCLITMSFKKVCHEKKVSWKLFFLKWNFLWMLSSILCIPLIYYTQPLNFFCESDYLWKKHSLKHHFSFSTSVLCTPTESFDIQKNIHGKNFP